MNSLPFAGSARKFTGPLWTVFDNRGGRSEEPRSLMHKLSQVITMAMNESSLGSIIGRHPSVLWKLRTVRHFLSGMAAPLSSGYFDRNEHGPFLFIVGSGRSGNTLMRRFLMEKADIYFPPETYVLPKIALYRFSASSLSWESLVELVVSAFEYHREFEAFNLESLRAFALEAKEWNEEDRGVSELIRHLYLWTSKQHGLPSSWVGDKTPLNTLHLGHVHNLLPKARYLYMLRDGADVSVSYVKAGIYDDLEAAAHRWLTSHASWEAFKPRLAEGRYIEVRYEDLVRDREPTMTGVLEALGVPSRPNTIDVRALLGDVNMHEHHSAVRGALSKDSIGKGRQSLRTSERKVLAGILNRKLAQLDYDPL